jgi:hypothetical protein
MTICDCCKREVDYVRASIWHGDHRICCECFIEWYDGDRPTMGTDQSNKRAIGDWVRRKHGLAALDEEV